MIIGGDSWGMILFGGWWVVSCVNSTLRIWDDPNCHILKIFQGQSHQLQLGDVCLGRFGVCGAENWLPQIVEIFTCTS